MAEYIEREALIAAIIELKSILNTGLARRNMKQSDIMKLIEEFPAANVAPKVNDAEGGREGGMGHVVRCEECIRKSGCTEHLIIWEMSQELGREVCRHYPLRFCSYGKRRTDECESQD